MTYIDQRLPQQMELNATRRELEPGLTINRKANGRETGNQRFSQGQLEYEVSFPPQGYTDSVITAVKELFRVSRGGQLPFRFRDFDPSMSVLTREPIGTGDGATTLFRVKKTWTVGGQTAVRTITKPATPLSVYKNNVLQTVTTHYTVNYDTGWITFVTPPTAGHVIDVSGYFDILVRFDKEYESEGLTHWLEAASSLRLIERNDV